MASGNDIRIAIDHCVNRLAGLPDAVQKIPAVLATVARPGKFQQDEVELIIEMATRRLTGDETDPDFVPLAGRTATAGSVFPTTAP